MNVKYQEGSDYGQLVLDLIGLIASLTEDNAIYNKKTIIQTLKEARGRVDMLIYDVKTCEASFFKDGE